MSTTNGGPPPGTVPNGAAEFGVMAQYIKDFSFEIRTRRSLAPLQQQPESEFRPMSPRSQSPTPISKSNCIDGKAEASGLLLLSFDLTFAGALSPAERTAGKHQSADHDRAPRLLLPFARDHLLGDQQWWIPAAAAQSGEFVCALPEKWSRWARAGLNDVQDLIPNVTTCLGVITTLSAF